MIQEQALLLSAELGDDDFTASNGWLQRWQQRHNVHLAVICGEAADVDQGTVDDWRVRLPSICKAYQLCDIFNADETGLFFRALPTRSMVAKGDSCKGGKMSKERITVLLCCSATGEKLTPLVIGRSQNPRCFRNQRAILPVSYDANRKAWMTRDVFRVWLEKINNKMRCQQRKILLLLDNCSAHPDLEFSNVRLVFLPPKTTSVLQPLDAGIIQAVKVVYRQKLLRHLLLQMNETTNATTLAKSVTVLDAILWLRHAWDCLREDTVSRCFAKCGISEQLLNPEREFAARDWESVEVEMPEPDSRTLSLLEEVTWQEFVNCDQHLVTNKPLDKEWETTLLAKARGKGAESDHEHTENEDEEDDTQSSPVPSAAQLAESLRSGVHFALEHAQPELMNTLNKALHQLEEYKMSQRLHNSCQKRLDFYFRKDN